MKAAKLILLPAMGATVVAAFLWPEPAEGFLGESSRIVFFHVPCAWTSTLAFLVAAGYSLAYLVRRNPWHDDIACAAVRIGLLFGILTLITGSLFANIMWGSGGTGTRGSPRSSFSSSCTGRTCSSGPPSTIRSGAPELPRLTRSSRPS